MSLRKNFDQIIKVPNGLWFNEIPSFEQIPNKSIIYKTIPGLGATFSEVIALRHSIIVLPHVSIIKNKHAKYKDLYKTFAVYGDSQTTKTKDILEYLCSDVAHKKFLTTPKGLDKIKNAFSQLGKLGMLHELYRDYFLLVDECHKWVKDTGYRNDMIPTMDDFFQFLNKAMVSATVIPMSDPRLELQGFKHIKLEPVFSIKDDEKNFRGDRGPFHPYKRDIKILNVNSITTGLKDYVEKRPVEKYCIFFNSIKGIKSIISELDILQESRIFCSTESVKLFKIDEIHTGIAFDASDEFKTEDADNLAKFNFFTSSFYTGLDIDLSIKPNVIILTDCYLAEHSIVDPFTDTIQIIGRFRNQMYKEVVHINNYTSFTFPLSEEKLNKQICNSGTAYRLIESLTDLPIDINVKDILTEAMSKLYPFADFIGGEGIYSTYKEDNYRDHNRVKVYYSQPYNLIAAYRDTQLFNLTWNKQVFEKDKLIHLQKNAGKYSIENNRLVSEALLELEDFLGTSAYIRIMKNIDKLFPIVTSAYRLIGFKGIRDLGFRKTKIIRELHILDLTEKRNLFPIDLVYSTFFKGHSYSRAYIKKIFQKFYDDLGLNITALATDILKYFEVKYKNKPVGGKSKSSWILLEHKYRVSASYRRP